MTDQEIIYAIREGGHDAESAVKNLMNMHQGMIYDMKSKIHLDLESSKDAFADALSMVVWNIKTNTFKGDSKISSYLYRIYYNKSVDLLRHLSTNKNRATQNIEDLDLASELSLNDNLDLKLDIEIVKDAIQSLGNVCKSIIMDWGYWGYSMAEIAIRNNIENGTKAKKMKYNCLKKLKEILVAKGM